MVANKRILIVDDDEIMISFMQRTLLTDKDSEYEVQTAASGEEALRLLQSHPFDLVLADLKMPGIDGLQLIEAVRQIDPDTRTILMTAYGSDEIEQQANRLSVFRYITKPLHLEDLRQAVRDALVGDGITGKGILIMSAERYEALTHRLHELKSDLGCQCVFLADLVGQIVVTIGYLPGLDLAALASVIGGQFATTLEIASVLGTTRVRSLDFRESEKYDIYSTTVGDNLILAILFDRDVRTSRMGSVWDYTRQAVEDLLAILETAEAAGGAKRAIT